MISRRALLCAALCIAALCTFSLSCRRQAPGPAAPIIRVVSMSPAMTETLFAVGAGAVAVGRSRFCDYPPEVRALPEIGGIVDPSYEAILALRPTLVIGADAQRAMEAKLAPRGIATFFPKTGSLDAIADAIAGVGRRTGHAAEADALVAKIGAQVDAIERAVAPLAKPRVLMVFGIQPIVVAGPGSFPDEMLRRAGAVNAVSSGGEYPTLGMERVIAIDADVIINAAVAEAHGRERITKDAPGWGSVRAVKAGKVVAIDDERVLRPGPRIAEGLGVVARALHPEAALP